MKERLRIGYSMWGFLGDVKCDQEGNRLVNGSPDGCASYVWAAWHALQARGHTVYMMQEDRDEAAWQKLGARLFKSHAQEKRMLAYLDAERTPNSFPELDVLVLEWRFKVPHKTTQDVERQRELLEHYHDTDTKIVIWDLDHKLAAEDEMMWYKAIVCEQSDTPRSLTRERHTLFTPVDPVELWRSQYHTLEKRHNCVYVGNNYERERAVDQYLVPLLRKWLDVHIWGKWLGVPDRWKGFHFHDRIDMRHFARAFSPAACSPLLAKDSYFENGVVTARVGECLQWGTIPVGLEEHKGIFSWTPYVARDGDDLARISEELIEMDDEQYEKVKERCVDMLERVHIDNWLDGFKKIVGA